jgi:hypothetical protein
MQHEEEVHEEEKVLKGVPALSLVIAGTLEMLSTLLKVAASLDNRVLLQEIGRSSEPRKFVPLVLKSARGNAEGWLQLSSPWEKFS